MMTFNVQYFASYPKDEDAAGARLREVTEGPDAPDIICVQEGIASIDVLSQVGYVKLVCSTDYGHAQSVNDMVYHHEATLNACDEAIHDEFLCNQLFLRQGSSWTVMRTGAIKISSDLHLDGSDGRTAGKLAARSMVWASLKQAGSGPTVYVMCTHITGGRFEDQYFVQQLAHERKEQVRKVLKFFETRRTPASDDIGIMVGDFNATSVYTSEGPMGGYYKMAIATSEGVVADAKRAGLPNEALERAFGEYMVSPFAAIEERGWNLCYTEQEVGATSAFGHLVDHMATNSPVEVLSTRLVYLTNQKFKETRDTDLALSDHNAIIAKIQTTSSAVQPTASLSSPGAPLLITTNLSAPRTDVTQRRCCRRYGVR